MHPRYGQTVHVLTRSNHNQCDVWWLVVIVVVDVVVVVVVVVIGRCRSSQCKR
jgi:uncharacterized membrane-anchored protein